mmetsp:Transcript_81301/g.197361  ORF Transcript_81301/g.197361 Transcript_81301/m.197361 type:complete len:457 (-) Transcript_81301:420-1790(-)
MLLDGASHILQRRGGLDEDVRRRHGAQERLELAAELKVGRAAGLGEVRAEVGGDVAERRVGEDGEELDALAGEQLRLLGDHGLQGEAADERDAVGAVEPLERQHVGARRDEGEHEAIEQDGRVRRCRRVAARQVGAQPRAAVVELVDATEAALERRVVHLPDPLPLAAGVPPHDVEAGRGTHVDEEVRAEEHEDVREVEAAQGGHRARAQHHEEARQLPEQVEVLVARREVVEGDERVGADVAAVGEQDGGHHDPAPAALHLPAAADPRGGEQQHRGRDDGEALLEDDQARVHAARRVGEGDGGQQEGEEGEAPLQRGQLRARHLARVRDLRVARERGALEAVGELVLPQQQVAQLDLDARGEALVPRVLRRALARRLGQVPEGLRVAEEPGQRAEGDAVLVQGRPRGVLIRRLDQAGGGVAELPPDADVASDARELPHLGHVRLLVRVVRVRVLP